VVSGGVVVADYNGPEGGVSRPSNKMQRDSGFSNTFVQPNQRFGDSDGQPGRPKRSSPRLRPASEVFLTDAHDFPRSLSFSARASVETSTRDWSRRTGSQQFSNWLHGRKLLDLPL
jgi:hypothetical protein